VETDANFAGRSVRRDLSGTPFIRERVYRMTESFFRASVYVDGFASPSGLTPFAVDMTTELQATADRLRDSGEDQQIHASVLTSGDWPQQNIGWMIFETGGTRVINLSSTSGRGAQIVATRIDPRNMLWEYLTESVALELRARDRELLGSTRVFYGRRRKPAV